MKAISNMINRIVRRKDTVHVLMDGNSDNSGLVVNRKQNGSIRNLRWHNGDDNAMPQKLDSQELLNKALENGVRHQQIDVVQKVLTKGADVNANNWNGDPIMSDAIRGPSRDIVQTLVRAGANMDAQVPSKDNATVRDLMTRCSPIRSQLEETPLGNLLEIEDMGQEIMSYLAPKEIPDNAILHDANIRGDRDTAGLRQLQTPLSHSSHVQKLEEEMQRKDRER